MGAALRLVHFRGSLAGLAERLRRRRLEARDIRATELVRQLRAYWATVESVDPVADELPVAAWVIRQKAAAMVPAETPPEPPPPAPPAGVDAWAETLRRLYAARVPAVAGPPRWPDAGPPRIAGATPARLAAAWPPTRQKRPPPVPVAVPTPPPLWRRAREVLQRLRRGGARVRWSRLVAGWGRPRRVDAFLIVLALWRRGAVDVIQEDASGEPEVSWRGRRSPARSAPARL
ncbi:MAG: hypothetical protein K6V97_11435 [Actinomycetia bacterium]|nr:hypothetical protein [Actinomycetes bacterium]